MTTVRLSGEKILVTGAAGQIGLPMVRFLTADNEVVGAARYRADGSRAKVTAAGARPVKVDLASGEYGDLPDDFTYVVHLAAYIGPNPDFDRAIRNNAESAGLLMAHCRKAKAVLIMSSHSVYRPNPDPEHAYKESDPLGETNAFFAPTYAMSKIGQEAVARAACRMLELPVVITRMNASYGPNGGLPAYDADAVMEGRPVTTRSDPSWYSPIHEDDINAHVGPLLEAATVPATIVNWAGDEVVSVQQWCGLAGDLAAVPAEVAVHNDGGPPGAIADVTRRRDITGPCRVSWRDGLRGTILARHPELAGS